MLCSCVESYSHILSLYGNREMNLNANFTIKARQTMELNILFQHQWRKD